jgi:hypothetical protein
MLIMACTRALRPGALARSRGPGTDDERDPDHGRLKTCSSLRTVLQGSFAWADAGVHDQHPRRLRDLAVLLPLAWKPEASRGGAGRQSLRATRLLPLAMQTSSGGERRSDACFQDRPRGR